MSNRNLGYKYKGHSAPHSSQVMARYVVISAVLWIVMSILGFVFLTDFRIADQFQMNPFADFATARSSTLNIVALLVLSALMGALAAIPALLMLFSLQPRIDFLQRKSGKSKGLTLLLLKQIPTIVLICTEVLLVSLALGTAPQLPRSWTEKPNLISEWSVFIYELFYYPLDNEHVASRWREALAPGKPTRTLNVFLPAALLSEQGSFPKLKKAMGESQPFFLTAPTFPALLAQVSMGQSAVEQKYLPPLIGENETGIVAGAGKSEFFLRSEWHAFENEGQHKRGKSGVQWDRHEAIRMRLAQSQFQLFLLFRLGFMAAAHDNWQWRNIASDDAHALERYVDKLLEKGANTLPYQNIQLGELEHHIDFVRNPFAPLDWPATLLPSEQRWLVSKLDTALSAGLLQIKGRKDLSVFVVPFPELTLRSPFSMAYFKPAEELKTKAEALRYGERQWLTPADLFFAGQTSEVEKRILLPFGGAMVQCLPLLMNPDTLRGKKLIKSDTVQKAMWNVVREQSSEKFVFPEKFAFLPMSELESMAFCREFSASVGAIGAGGAAGSTGVTGVSNTTNTQSLPGSASTLSDAPVAHVMIPRGAPSQRAWLFRMRPENALLAPPDEEHLNLASLAQSLLREAVLEKAVKKQ